MCTVHMRVHFSMLTINIHTNLVFFSIFLFFSHVLLLFRGAHACGAIKSTFLFLYVDLLLDTHIGCVNTVFCCCIHLE